ncbi:MAG TPA: NRDE family protein [Streptosporangiaceae bacterium]|nr:NRDE family protein [Streptosporangiaceae bacterium]
MCTAILSIEPGGPVLLAGVRDELVDRPWEQPARHWTDHPGLIGGRDLLAGGTWLAVAPGASRVACVLNGRGVMAPPDARRTRGLLPLQAADEAKLDPSGLGGFDPFHLLLAEPGAAMFWSWDGERLAERELGPGLYIVVNSGLGAAAGDFREHEQARLAHFLPRLRAAARPSPGPDGTTAQAWGDWVPLLNGDGLAPDDTRALIVRRNLGSGRIWGTTSISVVALGEAGTRYDFTAAPGDPLAWHQVSVV